VGIYLQSCDFFDVFGNIVNNIAGGNEGIACNTCNYGSIFSNVISSTTGDAISGTALSYTSIANNAVWKTKSGQRDIYLSSGERVTVTGNILRGNGTSDYGIRLIDVDNSVIANNVSTGHDTYGIRSDVNSNNNNISGNVVDDSSPYSIGSSTGTGTQFQSVIGLVSKTAVELQQSTPTVVGQMVWNSGTSKIFVSTGIAACGSWAASDNYATGP